MEYNSSLVLRYCVHFKIAMVTGFLDYKIPAFFYAFVGCQRNKKFLFSKFKRVLNASWKQSPFKHDY